MAKGNSIRRGIYRSIFESNLATFMVNNDVSFSYEEYKIKYEVPSRIATYTPDFILENGIVIEAKGIFEAKDRYKHILIKEQEPDYDIRFIFYNSKKTISAASKTTYGNWCDHHGFKWADKKIPVEWFKEKRGKSYEYIEDNEE
jgi:hypothetical protein